MSQEPEALAVRALRSFLLAALPAKCAELNGLRQAALVAAYAGPYVVQAGAQLRVSAVSREDAGTLVTLPSGAAVTADTIATAINAASPTSLVASADSAGRLVLTSTLGPASTLPSVVDVKPAAIAGSNRIFGWDDGGEYDARAALIAPGFRGVADGWPTSAPDMGRSFWVILGDRVGVQVQPDTRRDSTLVTIDLIIMQPAESGFTNRNREGISACVRAVRELLGPDSARYLGRVGQGDVMFSTLGKVTIPGKPFAFIDAGSDSMVPNLTFDFASASLTVRVFNRPS